MDKKNISVFYSMYYKLYNDAMGKDEKINLLYQLQGMYLAATVLKIETDDMKQKLESLRDAAFK